MYFSFTMEGDALNRHGDDCQRVEMGVGTGMGRGVRGGEFFALLLFVFFSTAGGFLLQGKLYWDTGRIFLQFRDQLHSLNVFGEPAFWWPHHQLGHPGFYQSLLGIPSCLEPAFAFMGLVVWVLGRMGVFVSHYQPLYVIYFGLLVPGIFLYSVLLFTRRIYKSPVLQRFILILSAFSPGIFFNLSDVGFLENVAYGIYFLTALWDVLKKPSPEAFRWLVVSSLVLGISFHLAFLYFNLFALSVFIIILIRSRFGFRFGGTEGRKGRGFIRLGLTIGIPFLVGAIPNLIALGEGGDLVRSSLGESKSYPLDQLLPGNPLEMATVSLPGFGFDWNAERTRWALMPLSEKYFSSYYYLGLLCLPLFLWGCLRGRKLVRRAVTILGILFFGILSLSAYSPFFIPLFFGNSPLRSCNHFSDSSFKAGGFLILIFGAAEGLRSLLFTRRRLIGFWGIYLFSFCFSFAVHLYFEGRLILENLSFGASVFSFLMITVILIQAVDERAKIKSTACTGLLWLVLLDVSTQGFFYVRNIWNSQLMLNSGWPAYHRIEEIPRASGLGILGDGEKHFYANTILLFRPYYQMLKLNFNPAQLPEFMVFEGSRPALSLPRDVEAIQQKGWEGLDSLPTENLQGIVTGGNRHEAPAISNLRRSYNQMDIHFATSLNGIFFIRDAYSPHWAATLDDIPVPIGRALYGFKGVSISKGSHHLTLKYYPKAIILGLCIAYGGFLLALVIAVNPLSLWGRRRIATVDQSPEFL